MTVLSLKKEVAKIYKRLFVDVDDQTVILEYDGEKMLLSHLSWK